MPKNDFAKIVLAEIYPAVLYFLKSRIVKYAVYESRELLFIPGGGISS
ncbi:hypothetical protein [Methanosarcina sp.]|nr:hypothetical protein [Methanosarcina sp.]MDY9926120.1 hypothetical protein [Methanosarcina sp.]